MKQILIYLLLALALFSCSPKKQADERPLVSVSILPQEYLLNELSGDLIQVNVMVPPGASPAIYEPSMSQLVDLENSERYFRIGHIGFELTWMNKISEVNPDMKVVDLSRNMDLITVHDPNENDHGHDHGHSHVHGTDPHIWMSARNMALIAKDVHSELVVLLPEHREELDRRLEGFLLKADSIHRHIEVLLKDLDQREFLIFHPSLGYFARDYDLIQHALELEGKTPSPAHMEMITDLALEKEIRLIFIQKQFDRSHAATLERETGARLLEFDPLSPDWEGEMIKLAENLAKGS